MHALVVGLDGDVIDDLKVECDTDAMRATLWMREEAVVVATTASETESITRECESRDENDAERGDFDVNAV